MSESSTLTAPGKFISYNYASQSQANKHMSTTHSLANYEVKVIDTINKDSGAMASVISAMSKLINQKY